MIIVLTIDDTFDRLCWSEDGVVPKTHIAVMFSVSSKLQPRDNDGNLGVKHELDRTV